jgi:hypothetical protein
MSAIYKNFLPVLFRGEAERNFEKYIKTHGKIHCYFGLSNKIYLNVVFPIRVVSIRRWILNIGLGILTGGNRRTDGKACHFGILSTTDLTWTCPVPRFCPGGKTAATNCLNL